jgi:hypothetical protein
LRASGKALWRSIISDADALEGDLDARELELLGQSCQAADHLAALEKVIVREGVTSTGSR